LRAFPIDPVLAACLNSSSSSPARTAAIRVSITAGSLSSDGTNDAGLALLELDPAGSVFRQGDLAMANQADIREIC
jgi:hypothetical protein